MIQLGKRNKRGALLVAVAAFGMSTNALAQTPPAPEQPAAQPTPEPGAQPLPTDPQPPPSAAPPPVAALPPPPAAPPAPAYPSMAGPFLKISDFFAFRPLLLLQMWTTAAQDPLLKPNDDAGDFAINMYMRRARMGLAGALGKDVTFTILLEAANLGLSNNGTVPGSIEKNYTQGLVAPGTATSLSIYEAYLDWRINPLLSIQVGSMLLPTSRNILQSASTYWQIDVSGVSAQHINATQTNTLREVGFQLKLQAMNNKLEFRGLVSQGVKIADTENPAPGFTRSPGKNLPRLTGYLQYNFLEGETGYVFNGMYFGKKRVLGIALGGDYQPIDEVGEENPYFQTAATLYAAIPLKGADPKAGGDEVGGQLAYLHYHGGGAAPASGLGKRDGILGELGYYNKAAKLLVFGRFENISVESLNAAVNISDTRTFGGGIKYFFAEQLFNLTLQYNLTQFPEAPASIAEAMAGMLPGVLARKDTSLIQLQVQLSL